MTIEWVKPLNLDNLKDADLPTDVFGNMMVLDAGCKRCDFDKLYDEDEKDLNRGLSYVSKSE